MKEYKVGWRVYVFLCLFIILLLGTANAIAMLLTGQVADENGEIDKVFNIIVSAMLSIVLFTYAYTTYNTLRQLFKFKGNGLTITSNGIENTVVFIYVLAFIIVVPVKQIPWEAVTYYDPNNNAPYIRVKRSQVEAGWFAKLLLLLGYHFCYSFVKPCVTDEDIAPYKYRFNIKEDNLLI